MTSMNESETTAYSRVREARNPHRPGIMDYAEALFDDFIELHGDRLYRDDPAVVGGIARFHGIPVTVIGHRKGRTTEERVHNTFGMASPEGYRKHFLRGYNAKYCQRFVFSFFLPPVSSY